MKTRNLKIEASGDFWRGKITPKIRLCGRWLEQARFKPGCRVEIQFVQPGKLTLQFLSDADNNSFQGRSATWPVLGDLL